MTERQVEPGTAGHDAAIRVIGAEPPARSPTRRPDSFRYDVSIGGPEGELWRATVSDPLPDAVAELLDAIR